MNDDLPPLPAHWPIGVSGSMTCVAPPHEIREWGLAAIAPYKAEIERLTQEHYFQACLTKELMPYQDRAVKAEAERDEQKMYADKWSDANTLLTTERDKLRELLTESNKHLRWYGIAEGLQQLNTAALGDQP